VAREGDSRGDICGRYGKEIRWRGGKDMKEMEERKKEGERFRYERSNSPLNLNMLFYTTCKTELDYAVT
jgi:hypothetical protein